MDRLGFIHEKLDIKVLILYILRRLPARVSFQELSDLITVDDGFGYFDFSQCLAELVHTGHVEELDGAYNITDLGAGHLKTLVDSLPNSVRSKADAAVTPVVNRMKRDALISAKHRPGAKNGFTVELSMSDDMVRLMELSLYSPNETQTARMEKRFKEKAEQIYLEIIRLLTSD